MNVGYVLAPQAAHDLEIWRYIKEETSLTMAERIEFAIRERIAFLAGTPGAGHRRKDLTDEEILPRLLLFNRLSTRDEPAANRLHSSRSPERGTNT
jgi:plasmid stabilization system protein ParE